MGCGRLLLVLTVVYSFSCGCGCGRGDTERYRTALFTVNLPSLTKFNYTAIKRNVVDFYRRVENRLNATYRFLRYNGSVGPLCGMTSDECNATARCCPNFVCAPNANLSGVFNCVEQNRSSSEEVANRIASLYADGSASHEWTNSWAMESKSTLEREEEVYKEEKEWKEKNVLDSTEEAVWKRLLKEVMRRGKEEFNKLQKMKKLNEVKQIFKDKLMKRNKQTKHYNSGEDGSTPELINEEIELNVITTKPVVVKQTDKQSAVEEPTNVEDEKSENDETKSEENLSSVLKSAEDLVKRHKKKHREQLKKKSDGKANEIDDVSWNEDELQKEIEKLKKLKEEMNSNKMNTESDRVRQDEMNDLIKKQVALILDEERKLEGLMKLEELKKLEDNMKREGRKI